MDPITGIGLAASVIQLVTFSIHAVKTCRDMHEQGQYSDLDYTTGHLASLTRSLQQSLQSSGRQSVTLSREEKDLLELGRKCEDCANKLQRELYKLQTQKRVSPLEAARLAARAIWDKGTINKIQKELEKYQSTLELSLLSRLSQRFDTQGLRNDRSFANQDRSMQQIITCLANSQTLLSELVEQKSEETRRCITAQFDRAERLHVHDRRYEEITNSLFYPDIFSRQEQVDSQFDGIEDSYDWVFNEPQTQRMSSPDEASPQKLAPRWDDFARWLKSGQGVYWINGKAGSGKSTLMRHICEHRLRLELLREWSSNRRLLTPTFFFWNAGSRMQKSMDGLLRSLVYQMLKGCRELIECFTNEPLYTWTQSRLVATLLSLLKQSQVPIATCMFIDGLDEFEGREDTVIEMIQALAGQAHVKVCLSSRPLPIFEEAFNFGPGLRLQDLTFDTIREYAKKQLSPRIQKRALLNKADGELAEEILTRVVEGADGVFLWAIIAIRGVSDGIRWHADLREVTRTIGSLPSELESLFMHMLGRIQPWFKRDAAYFLGVALYQDSDLYEDSIDLCRLHFSHSQLVPKDSPFSCQGIATNELVVKCRTLERHLLSHTGGLLELTRRNMNIYIPFSSQWRIYHKMEDLDPILFNQINFLHRTARDFLLENDEAKSFLAHNGSSEAQVRLSIARGTLAQLAHFSQGDAKVVDRQWPHPMFFPYLGVLNQISKAEKLLGAAQVQLIRSLDYTSLSRGYHISNDLRVFIEKTTAFMVEETATFVDIVGMAAAVGMTIYVCGQLDLTIESRCGSFSFPDLNQYSRNKTTAATVWWRSSNQLRAIVTGSATRSPSSNYRQALGECLQWKADTQSSSPTDYPSKRNMLVESYMLSCCTPTGLDLARILLAAGANPMVQVMPEQVIGRTSPAGSFWSSWLEYLLARLSDDIRVNGKTRGLITRPTETDAHVTFDRIFDTTKGLLARGADINYQMKERNRLIRRYPSGTKLMLSLTTSAMFILEECFNAEPGFLEFANAMGPLIERPTREIKAVQVPDDHYIMPKKYKVKSPCPSAEESKMLWPLIEKWEDRGSRDDLDALKSAMVEVWRAHNPGVIVRKRDSLLGNPDGSDDGENDDDESDDDEGDDGDEESNDDEMYDDEEAGDEEEDDEMNYDEEDDEGEDDIDDESTATYHR